MQYFVPKGQEDLAQGFNPGFASPRRLALKGRKVQKDQSHTYRSSNGIRCFLRMVRNSSWNVILR